MRADRALSARHLLLLLPAVAACGETSATSTADMAVPPADSAPAAHQYLFVSANHENTLHVYDIDDGFSAAATIPVCENPAEVRSRRDGKIVWTVCRSSTATDGGVTYASGHATFVDTSTLKVAKTVDVGVKTTHSYLMPDGKTALLCNDGSGDVTVVDTDTFSSRTIAVGKGHHKAAFATDGKGGALRFAYVSNITDSTISVLDPQLQLVTTIPVGLSPHGMDYSFYSKKVYNCSGDQAHDVEVIDTDGATAHTITARIPLDNARCGHLEVSRDGKTIFASQNGANQMALINADDNTVKYVPAGLGPDWFYEAQGSLWIDNRGAWTVWQLNLSTQQGAPLSTGPDLPDGGSIAEGGAGLAGWDPWVFEAQGPLNQLSVVNAEHAHVHMTLTGIPGASNSAVGGARGGNPYPR